MLPRALLLLTGVWGVQAAALAAPSDPHFGHFQLQEALVRRSGTIVPPSRALIPRGRPGGRLQRRSPRPGFSEFVSTDGKSWSGKLEWHPTEPNLKKWWHQNFGGPESSGGTPPQPASSSRQPSRSDSQPRKGYRWPVDDADSVRDVNARKSQNPQGRPPGGFVEPTLEDYLKSQSGQSRQSSKHSKHSKYSKHSKQSDVSHVSPTLTTGSIQDRLRLGHIPIFGGRDHVSQSPSMDDRSHKTALNNVLSLSGSTETSSKRSGQSQRSGSQSRPGRNYVPMQRLPEEEVVQLNERDRAKYVFQVGQDEHYRKQGRPRGEGSDAGSRSQYSGRS